MPTGRPFALLDGTRVVANPFASPVRARSSNAAGPARALKRRDRSGSRERDDDMASLFPPLDTDSKKPAPAQSVMDTPGTRARKRLRGEHVPPSPDKANRVPTLGRVKSDSAAAIPRNLFSQPATSSSLAPSKPSGLHRSSAADAISDDDDDDGLEVLSPVKMASGGRNFKPLFDETPAGRTKLSFTRSNTLPAGGLFARKEPRTNGTIEATLTSQPSTSSNGTDNTRRSSLNALKRTLDPENEEDDEDEDDAPLPPAPPPAPSDLLPPSPPPVKSTWQPKGRGGKPGGFGGPGGSKGGGRPAKKARMDGAGSDDSAEDDVTDGQHNIAWNGRVGKLPFDAPEVATDDADESDGFVLDEWERDRERAAKLRSHRAYAPPSPDSQPVRALEPRGAASSGVSDLLSVLALNSSPVRQAVGVQQTEGERVRELLMPHSVPLPARRNVDVWAAGESLDGGLEGEVIGAEEPAATAGGDDEWDDEGLRWDEAEL